MTISLAITLFVLGVLGGFFSGWLGIGGGIIMAPLLLYIPQDLGVGYLDMKVVAGLTMIQSLFATGSAVLIHRRFKNVSRDLVLWIGGGVTVATLGGALLSHYLEPRSIQAIFALLALSAALLMLVPFREEPAATHGAVSFSRPLALATTAPLGFLGGLVGQSGAFILIPVMLYVLRIPTRVTIGSSLGIVFLAALAGSAGKLITGQVEIFMALFCVSGALVGARAGAYLSQRTRTVNLRRALALVILLAAIRMVVDILDV
jgi:hypothetical protein